MDRSVSSCDNFYQYACGSTSYLSGPIDRLNIQNKDKIKKVYQGLIPLRDVQIPQGVEMSKYFYHTCLNTDPSQLLNDTINWLNKNVGPWPMAVDDWELSQMKSTFWTIAGLVQREIFWYNPDSGTLASPFPLPFISHPDAM